MDNAQHKALGVGGSEHPHTLPDQRLPNLYVRPGGRGLGAVGPFVSFLRKLHQWSVCTRTAQDAL